MDHKKKTELSYIMTYSKPKIPLALRRIHHQCISCSDEQCLDFASEHLPQASFIFALGSKKKQPYHFC